MGLLYQPTPFANQDQIWHATMDPECTISLFQTKFLFNQCILLYITMELLKGFCNHPLCQSRSNLARESTPTVYAYLHKFHLNWFIVSPLRDDKPQSLLHFQTQHSLLVPCSSKDSQLFADDIYTPCPIQQYQIISEFKRLHGNHAFTNFTVQKCD